MKEQLISFKTAKLAKEKGFNILTENLYDRRDYNKSWNSVELINRRNAGPSAIPAPTQSLLQKWLREEHGILVLIDLDITLSYIWKISSLHPQASYTGNYLQSNNVWGNYEEALENSLQEALNLIEL